MPMSLTSDGDDSNTECKTATIVEELRCKYPGKFCSRARVRKTTGMFHRYCQYHRHKANMNQKRWTSMRRRQTARQLRDMLLPGPQHMPFLTSYEGQVLSSYSIGLPDPVQLHHCTESEEISLEDAFILNALFISETDSMCE
jgi:hypothetical protein